MLKDHLRKLLLATAILMGISASVAAKPLQKEFASLEQSAHGRLGIYAINTGNAQELGYRADERFPLASTFKVIAVSDLLQKSVTAPELMQHKVNFNKKDLVNYSPITGKHLESGMTYAELSAAALQYSDNTAGNLIVKQLGGPSEVTLYARQIDDQEFYLERWETELNSATPGDVRDTTTPKAMAITLKRLAFKDVLPKAQRRQLLEWMKGNTTGDASIRAGLPHGWTVADKTGGGSYGSTNDIAVIWPKEKAKGKGKRKAPWVIAIYFTQSKQDAPLRKDVIAAATRLIVKQWTS
ncbi:class A beta-lactamase [Dongshaea marina]|uniref:class A beta-lactamase n=1 Tax=Dongshaea marina TaxID=2047966 RepID=UPI000D3E8B69|nr:class A beta-lactamase [Dongshaea marina]